MINPIKISISALLGLSLLFTSSSYAQDIEPRRWSNLPLGFNFVGVGYGYTTGDLFVDPLLEIEDASFNMHSIGASYVRPFKIGTKLARIDVLLPFSFGNWTGLLRGEPESVDRTGFNDPRVRFSINLLGAPAGSPAELRAYLVEHPVNTTLGVSVAVTMPLGQYFEEKLINLGSNRFTIRPQIGMVHNWNRWSYELTGSVFMYTNNNNFFNGKKQEQKPIYALQSHIIRFFKNNSWVSASIGYGTGGESTVDNESKDDVRDNLLGSASFGFRISKNQSAKVFYLWTDAIDDVGFDAHTFGFAWSIFFT